MLVKFKETIKNLISAFQKYRGYYDQKALAHPLKLHSFCLLLDPLLTTQSDIGSKSMQVSIPMYRVEKVLTSSNYIIRKMGTNNTQCVHLIRLRPVIPQHQPEDLKTIDPRKFETDPLLGKYRSETELFDDFLSKLLDGIQPENGGQSNLPDATVQIRLSKHKGGPAAAPIPLAVVPIPAVAAAPIIAPLPPVPPPIAALPPRAIPPNPDPEPSAPPEFDYNDGLNKN